MVFLSMKFFIMWLKLWVNWTLANPVDHLNIEMILIKLKTFLMRIKYRKKKVIFLNFFKNMK